MNEAEYSVFFCLVCNSLLGGLNEEFNSYVAISSAISFEINHFGNLNVLIDARNHTLYLNVVLKSNIDFQSGLPIFRLRS